MFNMYEIFNSEIFFTQSSPLQIHIISGILGLILGAIQFARPKGSAAHKIIGYVWLVAFGLVIITSFFIYELKMFGPLSIIHFVSIAALFVLISAIQAIRKKDIVRHENLMKQLYFYYLIVAAAFTLMPGRIMYQIFFG